MRLQRALLCLFFLIILFSNANALKSESSSHKSISMVASSGGETLESSSYRNIVSVGIIAGKSTSSNYIIEFGFAQTILHADGQPCTTAGQCEGGFCCSSLCQSSACPTPSAPSGGAAGAAGGGGGGGGAIIPAEVTEADFSVSPSSLEFQLTLGDSSSKSITVANTGGQEISFSVSLFGESQYLGVSDNSFTLAPGQQKTIVAAASGNKVGSYVGEIRISSGEITKTVPFLMEVESTQILFDVKLDILSEYKQVVPGTTLRMQVTLINIGAGKNAQVEVTYLIKDTSGKIIHESSQSLAVEQQLSYLKEIKIPELASLGDHIAVIELRYSNSFAVSSELFKVVEKVAPPSVAEKARESALSKMYYILIAAGSLAIAILYVISRVVSKKRRKPE